jgi:hypothetical protein
MIRNTLAQLNEVRLAVRVLHDVDVLVEPLDVPRRIPAGRVDSIERGGAICDCAAEYKFHSGEGAAALLPLECAPGLLDRDGEVHVATLGVVVDHVPDRPGDAAEALSLRAAAGCAASATTRDRMPVDKVDRIYWSFSATGALAQVVFTFHAVVVTRQQMQYGPLAKRLAFEACQISPFLSHDCSMHNTGRGSTPIRRSRVYY